MGIKIRNETPNIWCLSSTNSDVEKSSLDNRFKSLMSLPMASYNDYIIIFGDKGSDFIEHCARKYKVNPLHLIFTPGLEDNMNEDIYNHIIFRISQKLSKYKAINLIPRRIDGPFLKWAAVLRSLMPTTKISFTGDSTDWQNVFGNKSILHPRVNSKGKSVWNYFFSDIKGWSHTTLFP